MKVAIVGAGPAGIFLTLFLKNFSGKITLFDQNKRIGEKLRITGGGRMNVTNKVFGTDQFSSENERFLGHLFRSSWIEKRFDLFEELGTEYYWEENRAILKSQNAIAETERLNKKIEQQPNANTSLRSKIIGIEKQDDGYEVLYEKDGKKSQEFFDFVVLSGGAMFRLFDRKPKDQIYKLPLSIGHTITETSPCLSPLKIPENPLKSLSGISFMAKLFDSNGKNFCINNVLITHVGVSGPVCLDFSAMKKDKNIFLSFLPDISEEDFSKAFLALRQGKHTLRKFLLQWLPKRLVDWHIDRLGFEVTVNISDVSKEKEKNLKQNLFHFELKDVESFDYNYCWTTNGGVALNEVNMGTLESKKNPGIYFAGEILDVSGLCGGYNISFAAISAKIVSEALLKK